MTMEEDEMMDFYLKGIAIIKSSHIRVFVFLTCLVFNGLYGGNCGLQMEPTLIKIANQVIPVTLRTSA